SISCPRSASSRSTCATNVPRSGASGPGYICATSRMRTGTAYAGPARGSGCGGAPDGLDDEVGAALEEQLEQPLRAEQAGGAPEQREQPCLVEACRPGSLHRRAAPGRDLPARAELPGRIQPLAVVADREELAAVAQLLHL